MEYFALMIDTNEGPKYFCGYDNQAKPRWAPKGNWNGRWIILYPDPHEAYHCTHETKEPERKVVKVTIAEVSLHDYERRYEPAS